ncbi:MAG: fibronectin type III domain-containing protein, partial [bacterium]|nr:fibronectin type III domain-containing protein [bacterium]
MMRLRHTLFIVAVLASSFLAPNYAAAYLTWADMHPCGGTQPPASPINVVSRGMDQIQLYNEPGSWNTVLRDSVDLGVFMDDFTDTYNLVPNTTYTYQLGVKDTNPTSPTYGNILSTSNPVSVTTLSANSTPTPTDPAIELPVGAVGKSYTFYATAYPDPDGQQVKVRFDWGDGATSDTACFTPATGGTVVNRSHTWSAVGYYGVKAAEVDSVGRWSSWTTALGYGGTGSMSIGRGDDVTLPTTPGNFSATAIAVSPTRIDLKWDLSTDNYSVKGYRIYRNGVLLNDFASTYSLNKYYLADTAWYYSDYGLPPSTLYTYKIDAIDPSGNISTQSLPAIATTYSAPDATAPTVPTGISTLSANLNQAVIEWNDSTDNIGVAGYKIYRNDTSIGQSIIYDSPSTDPRGSADYTMITSSLPTRYIDYGPSGGFVAGTTYTYKVAAYDAAYNTSAQSASVSATPGIADTTAPTTPAGLSATAVSSSQINLSWTASTDAVGVTGYSIYRNGGTTPLATVTGTSYSDTELSPATSYSYVVKAADAAGNLSSSSASASATTESAQVLADTTAPTTPAGLSATAVSSSQINLSWTASTDAVGVTGYKIYRNGGTTPLATVTTTSYSNTGLSADTSYSYTVKATDVAGNLSLSSASANATTETASVLADTTLPTVPIGLSATAVSSSQINLSWTASTDTVSVTGYKIYRNGGTTPLATVTETSYSNTGLSAGTNYSYTVKAVDAAGNLSLSSASANATTLAVVIVDTQAPTIPTGLVATKNVYNEVDLSWTASTD